MTEVDDVQTSCIPMLEALLNLMQLVIESQRALIKRLDRGAARSEECALRIEARLRELELRSLERCLWRLCPRN